VKIELQAVKVEPGSGCSVAYPGSNHDGSSINVVADAECITVAAK
jgi:hypothetical protein